MHRLHRHLPLALLAAAVLACGSAETPEGEGPDSAAVVTATPGGAASDAPAPAAAPAAAPAGGGTARVSLVGDGVNVDGEFPATICGGPYLLGRGMSYQTRAGDWQVTLGSEERQTGDVRVFTSETPRSIPYGKPGVA